jgi:hypothetical protein
VDLEREAHADLVGDVDDRVPAVGEVAVAGLDHLRRHRREARDDVPHARPGEAGDRRDPEARGGAQRRLDLVGGAGADALGVAVTPDVRGHDRLVALVERVVADALADEVRRDRPAAQAVALEHGALGVEVTGLLGARDLEVVAPGRELEAVEAPGRGLLGERLQRQVSPLAREQRDRSSHARTRLLMPDSYGVPTNRDPSVRPDARSTERGR